MSTPPPTEREIQQQFEAVVQQASRGESDEITVLFGAADPEQRPDGVTWVPETNTLTYDLWDAQRDALESVRSDTDITVLLAGFGSGKSELGARWLIKQAIDHSGSRFLCMGQDFQKAKQTTYPKLYEALPGENTRQLTSGYCGPEQSPLIEDFNRQDFRLTFTNGAEITLGSADDYGRYAGAEFGAAWLDECGKYGRELYGLTGMITTRLRGVEGPKTQLWTLTDEEGSTAVFDILQRGVDASGDPIGLNIDVITASSENNPYLDAGTIERYKRRYGGTSLEGAALHGGFGDSSGTLLSREQLQFVHVDDLPEQNYRFHIGVDLSYVASKSHAEATDSDYTAAVLVGVDSDRERAYVFDVDRKRGMTLRQSIQWLADLANEAPQPTIKVEEVGAQSWWIQEAKQEIPGHIVPVSPGNNSKESRIQDMSILFERGDVVLCDQDRDDNLGYDARFRPFVREWLEFGNGNSPDLLDATYYALQNIQFGQSNRVAGASGDFYSRK